MTLTTMYFGKEVSLLERISLSKAISCIISGEPPLSCKISKSPFEEEEYKNRIDLQENVKNKIFYHLRNGALTAYGKKARFNMDSKTMAPWSHQYVICDKSELEELISTLDWQAEHVLWDRDVLITKVETKEPDDAMFYNAEYQSGQCYADVRVCTKDFLLAFPDLVPEGNKLKANIANSEKDEIIGNLEQKLKGSTEKIKDLSSQLKNSELTTKEHNSLFRLIAGMATHGYDYHIENERNAATSDIADNTGLDNKTVKKWVDLAIEYSNTRATKKD